jgi:thiol-disulfide isomerase/thioredoxin
MKAELQSASFELASEWLNRKVTARQTKGHPTLVHFWSISSETSKTNLAQVAQLRDQRRREGLRVVAVHVPQSDAEKDPRTVRDAIARLNLTEPCALDNDFRVSQASANLPAYFLIDPDGEIRASATGANGLDDIEDELDRLLAELRSTNPFCAACELFLNKDAMFCADCGSPLTLPGPGTHPYYESHFVSSLPTIQLVNPDPLLGHKIDG